MATHASATISSRTSSALPSRRSAGDGEQAGKDALQHDARHQVVPTGTAHQRGEHGVGRRRARHAEPGESQQPVEVLARCVTPSARTWATAIAERRRRHHSASSRSPSPPLPASRQTIGRSRSPACSVWPAARCPRRGGSARRCRLAWWDGGGAAGGCSEFAAVGRGGVFAATDGCGMALARSVRGGERGQWGWLAWWDGGERSGGRERWARRGGRRGGRRRGGGRGGGSVRRQGRAAAGRGEADGHVATLTTRAQQPAQRRAQQCGAPGG